MSWGYVAVGVGTAIAGVASASSANKASKRAANAVMTAEEQAIELQRQQLEMAQGLMQPYVNSGARSQAALDALTFGSGSYAATNPPALGGAATAQANQRDMLEQILRAQNPDMVSFWDRWEAAGESRSNGHRATFGDFIGYVSAERPQALQAAQQELATVTQQAEQQLAANGGNFTRADVEALIRQSVPYQLGEQSYAAQAGIADGAYANLGAINQGGLDRRLAAYQSQRDELGAIEDEGYARDLASFDDEEAAALGIEADGLARDVSTLSDRRTSMLGTERAGRDRDLNTYASRRDDALGIENAGYARDVGIYGDELDARLGLAGEEWMAGIDLAGFNRGEREAETARARAAMRGVGDENFTNTSGMLADSYSTRQGLTTNAVNAWDAQAQVARDRGIDAAASRMGVTGQTGRAARTMGELEQDYARDRSIYEADRRLADFNAYDSGMLGADALRGQTYLGAEQNATNQGWQTVNAYADDLQGAQDTYYGRANPALTDYYDSYAARAGQNTNALQGISGEYYGAVAERDALNTLRELGLDEAYYNDLIARYGSNTAALQAISQRSYAQRNQRSETNTANQANQAQQYWDDTTNSYAENDAARRAREQWYAAQQSQNEANRSANQQNSYADYVSMLQGQTDRGYNASQMQAGYGAAYTRAASDSIGRAADAASGYALARGQVDQDMYGQIANAAGNAWTGIQNNQNRNRYAYSRTGSTAGSGAAGIVRNT